MASRSASREGENQTSKHSRTKRLLGFQNWEEGSVSEENGSWGIGASANLKGKVCFRPKGPGGEVPLLPG